LPHQDTAFKNNLLSNISKMNCKVKWGLCGTVVTTYAVPLLASLLAKDVLTTAEPYLNGCLSSTTSNLSENIMKFN
jgi:hypothetical protein